MRCPLPLTSLVQWVSHPWLRHDECLDWEKGFRMHEKTIFNKRNTKVGSHIIKVRINLNNTYLYLKSVVVHYRLSGALLDVSNIKVVGNCHLVVEGCLSMEVSADFHIFCPKHGMELTGIINKVCTIYSKLLLSLFQNPEKHIHILKDIIIIHIWVKIVF